MDIVAESLSAKILKSREVLVNGKDIMDYIRSKLSVAVEFSGVYDSLEEANAAGANFNGSIVIVGSMEYIWSDKDNSWHEIGDETAVGQLVEYLDALSVKVDNLSSDLIGEASDLSSASTINAAKNYAKDLVDSLDVVDGPVQNLFVVAVSLKDGVISVERAQLTIPEGLSSYADTVANLSNDGYVLSTELSTKNKVEISLTFDGELTLTDLSVIKVTEADLSAYFTALVNDALNPNAVYVLLLSALNAFGQKVENVASGTLSSDAATYGLLSATVSHVDEVSAELSTEFDSKLSTKNKVQIALDFNALLTLIDLSVIKVTNSDLSNYAASLNADALNPNAIYVLQLSALNAFGQKVENVAPGTLSSDAATYGLLSAAVSQITSDYATTTYVNDVSAALSTDYTAKVKTVDDKLSGYYLKSETSSATEINNAIAGITGSLTVYAQTADLGIRYDSTRKEILFTGGNSESAVIDASEFIKDGMLSTATYDPATKNIILIFNTESGADPISIDVGDLVDTYTAGDTATIDMEVNNNEFTASIVEGSITPNLLSATAEWVFDCNI